MFNLKTNLGLGLTLVLGLGGCKQEYNLAPLARPQPHSSSNGSPSSPLDPGAPGNNLDPDTRDPSVRTEVFNVAAEAGREHDIIIAIDTSGSMSQEIEQTRASIRGFISNLVQKNASFHVGILTTDHQGNLGVTYPGSNYNNFYNLGAGSFLTSKIFPATAAHYFSSNILNAEDMIARVEAAVNLPINGSGEEDFLFSIVKAIKNQSAALTAWNAGFLRAGASLTMIGVSDEDASVTASRVDRATQLHGSTVNQRNYIRKYPAFADVIRDEYIAEINATKPGRPDLTNLYTVVGDPAAPNLSSCPLNSEGDDKGTGEFYKSIVSAVGGGLIDLCAGNFTAALSQIGFEVANQVQRNFQIAAAPADELQIKVYLDSQEIMRSQTNGFTYDSVTKTITLNGLDLEARQETGYTVQIVYTVQ